MFELIELIIGIVVFEFENIFDSCAPEGIDALGIITDNTKIMVDCCKLFDNQVLRVVGILVFINKNVAETLLINSQRIWKIAEKDIGIHQKIVKIHGI